MNTGGNGAEARTVRRELPGLYVLNTALCRER